MKETMEASCIGALLQNLLQESLKWLGVDWDEGPCRIVKYFASTCLCHCCFNAIGVQ